MSAQSQDKANFGAKLTELEAITTWFESTDVDLNEALTKFERGMQLADELKRELAQVENRVEKIRAKFDAPVTGESGESDSVGLAAPDSNSDSPSLF